MKETLLYVALLFLLDKALLRPSSIENKIKRIKLKKMEEKIVISLGGSLVFPKKDKIDVSFLKKFKKIILWLLRKKKKIALVVGGGKIARFYQKILFHFDKNKNNADKIGIILTRANAFLVKSLFQKKAEFLNWEDKIFFKKKIIVLGGKKPGFSTDYCTVLLAKKLKVKEIINLSNVDFIYNKDPKKFKDAKPIKEAKWKEIEKIFKKEWKPGLSLPFDPKAFQLAKKEKMTLYFLNGKKLKNLKNFFEEKKFKGTKIF